MACGAYSHGLSASWLAAARCVLPPRRRRPQDAEKARQLFQQGSKYYDLGQFDKAIEAWQQGYDQKPDPGLPLQHRAGVPAEAGRRQGDLLLQGLPPELAQGAQPRRGRTEDRGPAEAGGRHRHATTPPPPGNDAAAAGNNRRRRRRNNTPPPPNSTVAATSPTDADRHGGATAAAGVHGRAAHDGRRGHCRRPTCMNTRRIDAMAAHRSGLLVVGRQRHARSRRSCSTRWPATPSATAARASVSASAGCFGYTFLARERGQLERHVRVVPARPDAGDPADAVGPRCTPIVDFGLGVQALSGLEPRSKLLAPSEMLAVNGAQSMLVSRFGAALGFRVTPGHLVLHVAGADEQPEEGSTSTRRSPRVEWLFGACFRFGPRSMPVSEAPACSHAVRDSRGRAGDAHAAAHRHDPQGADPGRRAAVRRPSARLAGGRTASPTSCCASATAATRSARTSATARRYGLRVRYRRRGRGPARHGGGAAPGARRGRAGGIVPGHLRRFVPARRLRGGVSRRSRRAASRR